MKTLAELYCESHRVPTEHFEHDVLRRCLYPQARCFKNFLTALDTYYFEPDLELVRATGKLTRSSAFAAEVAEYNYHSANSGRLRREWKLRLSVTRLRAIVLETLGEEAVSSASMAPFAVDERPTDAEPLVVRVPVHGP